MVPSVSAPSQAAGTGRAPRRSLVGAGVLLVVLLAAPWLGLADQRPLIMGVMTIAVFTYAWHLVGGILGELSLAHIIFWGAGGYTLVLCLRAGWSVVPALLLCSIVGAVLASFLVGFLHLARLEGVTLMVFTLVLAYLATAVARASDLLGRTEGLSVPSLPFSIPTLYTVVAVTMVAFVMVNILLLNSRRGLVWLAIRDDAPTTESLGWSVHRERLIAYVASGAMCGFGGALQISIIGHAGPDTTLGLHILIIALLAIYVGGPGTVWGPLAGVVLLEGLATVARVFSSDVQTAQIARLLQYSLALVLIALLLKKQRDRRGIQLREPADAGTPAVPASDTVAPTSTEANAVSAGVGSSTDAAPTTASDEVAPVPPDAAQLDGLHVSGLSKSFDGLQVLRSVSFSVGRGEVLGLVGPNGAGKTTICNIIAGQLSPNTGDVMLGGQRVTELATHRRATVGLGRGFQTPRTFDSLDMVENVVVATTHVGTAQAERILTDVGIDEPRRLAGSATLVERRLVEIARLLAAAPEWVLLDEPLAGLTRGEHEVILTAVHRLATTGASVLIIEHLVPLIAPVVDRMIVLDGGVLIAEGPPREVLRDEAVVDAYLGQPVEMAAEELER